MNKLKVIQILPELNIGGVERGTKDFSKIPPFDITMESWPLSTRAFEKSLVPLSTPPIFSSGKI